MKTFFKRHFIISASLFSIISHSAFGLTPLQESLDNNLSFMNAVYDSMYAPATWKKSYAGWDLNDQINLAKNAGESNPNLTLTDAQQIVKNFIYSMKDYHVSLSFNLTETANLPFIVHGTKDKYFIVYVDRSQLSESAFPFHPGDEIVSFGGKSTEQAVAEVQAETPSNVPETDKALAELYLTNRRASRGLKVPQGPITVGIKAKYSDKVQYTQLIWNYTPESIHDPFSNNSRKLTKSLNNQKMNLPLLNPEMSADFNWIKNDSGVATPYDLGGRKSFTPDLGHKIWESSEDNSFYAYIFKDKNNRLIGYVRIPSYVPDDTSVAVEEFSQIINKFEEETDALVIDQVNNPGGSVFYLYTLASMLSDQPLANPQHKMAINQKTIQEAYTELAQLSKIKNEHDVNKAFPDGLGGYPATYQSVQFMKGYLNFLISEWNAGKKLTSPFWIAGVDQINPNPNGQYTKPILLLVNELDFSGGDFFPATLQDNKRVTVMGTRTSGAGGYVYDVEFPNNLGIDHIRVTESIAYRSGEEPIENLGVTPDVPYALTESDYRNNYKPYVNKILETVSKMVP